MQLLLLVLSAAAAAVANVEKILFTGPAPAITPPAPPALADLVLAVLAPAHPSLRTNLSRALPGAGAARGLPAWLLLDDLAAGRRYELRVCWAATEPTSFALDVYELDTVWQTPELIRSLTDYAAARRTDPVDELQQPKVRRSFADRGEERKASALLLRIRSAADYFTDDEELMKNPPPVLVDVILDPFLYNLVPQSLAPTAAYLVLVGIVTWFAAQWIASTLQSVAGSIESREKRQD